VTTYVKEKVMKYDEFLAKINSNATPTRQPVTMRDGHVSFNRDIVQAVLGGELSLLSAAFTWDETPHGHDYWEDIESGDERLSYDDEVYLRGLVDGV